MSNLKQNKNKKKKLLFICNRASYFNMHWRYRALNAIKAGYDVYVAVPELPTREDAEELKWVEFNLDRRSRNPLTELFSGYALLNTIRKIKPDLIHSITIKPNLYSGFISRFIGDIPVVMSVTGLGYLFIDQSFSTSVIRELAKMAYRWIGKSDNVTLLFENWDDRKLFLDSGIGNEKRCIRIPGAGIDLTEYYPSPELDGIPVVMLPSRMLWDKGVMEFVEAAKILKDKGVKAKFVLVGDTDQGNPKAVPSTSLKCWADEGYVEWWGFQENMVNIFSKSNIVCLPSYREGLPRALIEAAACARAIVTTDVPGCREIVKHGKNGLLVPAKDSTSLATALEKLINEQGMREKMGCMGREFALREYSQERVLSMTLKIYDAILCRVPNI